MAGKQHRGHAATACAVEFLGEVDSRFQSFTSALIIPIVFQPAFAVVEETDVLITRSRSAADADLIHHIDVALRFSPWAADVKCCRDAALQHMNQRKTLTNVDIL